MFELLSIFYSFCHLVVFVKLPVVVLNHPVYIFHLCCYLLFICHTVQRWHYILYLRISHLLPILLRCLHFSFFCWFCAVLNTDELCLVVHHAFLRYLHLHSLVFGKGWVKLLYYYWLFEFQHEERFVFLFQQMGYILMVSKIFAKKFETLLRVKEFFNTPDTNFINSSIFPNLVF